MGSQSGEHSDSSVNGQQSVNRGMGFDESLNYANLFDYKDQSQDLTLLNLPSPSFDPTQYNLGLDSRMNSGVESSDDSDSDDVFKYIRELLLEEDMEQKPCMFHDSLALQAAERPFSDVLGTTNPISPDQHPIIDDHFVHSPDDPSLNAASVSSGDGGFSSSLVGSSESHKSLFDQTISVESYSQPSSISQPSFGTVSALDDTTSYGSKLSSFSLPMEINMFSGKDSIMQFQKGMEEANKFLPKNNIIVIDLENIDYPDESKEAISEVVKEEKDKHSPDGCSGSKIHYREEDEFDEGRISKQSAISPDEADLSDMFDRVLLCPPMKHEAHCTNGLDTEKESLPQPGPKSGQESGKDHSRKNGAIKKNTVDLRTLLILCAQSVASDDRRTADELLKQIRDNSSNYGDGSQRLTYYFANALEARLAGTGSQMYTALGSKRTTAAEMINAYQFYMRTCPFKKISTVFANNAILKAAENKSKLHIIDFGILYGFQWPLLIQRLSERSGGPPKLCITGIDLPQPGFRPAERVETTGRRLANYCERFKVPFEYHAIAQKWETIKLEDLKIERDGVVAVNSLFRFKNLLDETIMVDSPRNAVLNLMKQVKPDIFLQGIVNGSFNSPFFVTRFREALFHYSTLFDMFDANASREEPQRFIFEKEFYGREIMNVVACEGTERIERPETYKQWQVRNNRAGFRQHRLDPELLAKLRSKVKENYHKDFVIDVDGQWVLLGWKGRITKAVSAWIPT